MRMSVGTNVELFNKKNNKRLQIYKIDFLV